MLIELFGEQFKWNIRYAGLDNKLSLADYKLVSKTNTFGIISDENIENKIAELDSLIFELNDRITHDSLVTGTMKPMNWKL